MRKTLKRNWICMYSKKHADKTNFFFFSEVQIGSGVEANYHASCHLRHKWLQICWSKRKGERLMKTDKVATHK